MTSSIRLSCIGIGMPRTSAIGRRLRTVLVVSEIALAVVLCVLFILVLLQQRKSRAKPSSRIAGDRSLLV